MEVRGGNGYIEEWVQCAAGPRRPYRRALGRHQQHQRARHRHPRGRQEPRAPTLAAALKKLLDEATTIPAAFRDRLRETLDRALAFAERVAAEPALEEDARHAASAPLSHHQRHADDMGSAQPKHRRAPRAVCAARARTSPERAGPAGAGGRRLGARSGGDLVSAERKHFAVRGSVSCCRPSPAVLPVVPGSRRRLARQGITARRADHDGFQNARLDCCQSYQQDQIVRGGQARAQGACRFRRHGRGRVRPPRRRGDRRADGPSARFPRVPDGLGHAQPADRRNRQDSQGARVALCRHLRCDAAAHAARSRDRRHQTGPRCGCRSDRHRGRRLDHRRRQGGAALPRQRRRHGRRHRSGTGRQGRLPRR